MRLARSLAALTLAGAAAAAWFWRRQGLPERRVDLYLEDGTLLAFEGDSAEAATLLPHVRAILDAAS